MTIYRKIWIEHFGPIPKDEDGRTYEIHHIDGNSSNNHIDNLKCITIQEHYDIHYSQCDWGACYLIAKRIGLDSELKSDLARKDANDRVQKGTHHFLGGAIQRKNSKKRVEEKSHNFQNKEFRLKYDKENGRKRKENGTTLFQNKEFQKEMSLRAMSNENHPFYNSDWHKKQNKIRIENGTHNFTIKVKCPYCDVVGGNAIMQRWHFNNCKKRK